MPLGARIVTILRRDPGWPWARTVLLMTLVLWAIMFAYGPRAFYWNRPHMYLSEQSVDWIWVAKSFFGIGAFLLIFTNFDIFFMKGTWSRLPASAMLSWSVLLVGGSIAAMGIMLWFFFWDPWLEPTRERRLLHLLFRLARRVQPLKWLGGGLIVWGLWANSTPWPLALAVCVSTVIVWIAGLRWLAWLRRTAQLRGPA